MPRANRHWIDGHVWHITGRCHRREFLLKFAKDRRHWVAWLFEARKRFQLCVLNYQVTSNHIHLLVHDRGRGEIERAMQLVEGRTAQAYNRRRNRRNAFWGDRYHATAVDSDAHLLRCLIYIDLNMVRAGVVDHPSRWPEAGYHEIQKQRTRRRIIDRTALSKLLGIAECDLAAVHARWVDSELERGRLPRVPSWSEPIAVGRRSFVARFRDDLGSSGRYRKILDVDGVSILREAPSSYGLHSGDEMASLRAKSAPESA